VVVVVVLVVVVVVVVVVVAVVVTQVTRRCPATTVCHCGVLFAIYSSCLCSGMSWISYRHA
jgi:hypothetical protein